MKLIESNRLSQFWWTFSRCLAAATLSLTLNLVTDSQPATAQGQETVHTAVVGGERSSLEEASFNVWIEHSASNLATFSSGSNVLIYPGQKVPIILASLHSVDDEQDFRLNTQSTTVHFTTAPDIAVHPVRIVPIARDIVALILNPADVKGNITAIPLAEDATISDTQILQIQGSGRNEEGDLWPRIGEVQFSEECLPRKGSFIVERKDGTNTQEEPGDSGGPLIRKDIVPGATSRAILGIASGYCLQPTYQEDLVINSVPSVFNSLVEPDVRESLVALAKKYSENIPSAPPATSTEIAIQTSADTFNPRSLINLKDSKELTFTLQLNHHDPLNEAVIQAQYSGVNFIGNYDCVTVTESIPTTETFTVENGVTTLGEVTLTNNCSETSSTAFEPDSLSMQYSLIMTETFKGSTSQETISAASNLSNGIYTYEPIPVNVDTLDSAAISVFDNPSSHVSVTKYEDNLLVDIKSTERPKKIALELEKDQETKLYVTNIPWTSDEITAQGAVTKEIEVPISAIFPEPPPVLQQLFIPLLVTGRP